jgi:NADPH-dependent 2,4-dienoyl-CoA reductase/sulfur reductase-like enzyme
VVGASLAGVHAVDELRRRGYDGDLTLVGAESELPYDRPPLSKAALAGLVAGEQPLGLPLRTREWYDERDIVLRLGASAGALDPGRRVVQLTDGTALAYDGLVVATGSELRPSPLAQLPNAHELRTFADARRLAKALGHRGHLLVIGAGFIGMEVAATAAGLGHAVTVVDVAPRPLARVFGTTLGRWFHDKHGSQGVRVVCSSGVARAEPAGDRTRVELTDGTQIGADVVLVGVGTRPATGWLEGSGLDLAEGVLCDPALATSAPGVVAAGDVARWRHPLFADEIRIEHWTNAVEQGSHAAATLLGEPAPFDAVPMFWTDQYDARTRCLGLPDPTDDLTILHQADNSVVAVTAREGVVRGAICINAPRRLPALRQAIADGVRVDDLTADPIPAS